MKIAMFAVMLLAAASLFGCSSDSAAVAKLKAEADAAKAEADAAKTELALLKAQLAGPDGKSKVDDPAVQKTAEQLARDWTFGPGTQKLQAWGSELTKSGEKLVVVSCRLRDDGKAKEWFARMSKFYSDKCGSDKDPVKLNSESGKHQLGIHGENKAAHFLIHEPGLMSIPISQIPPKPNELLFAHSDAESTVTVFIWQQSDDVVMIALTAVVR